jgi:hypothetical protein
VLGETVPGAMYRGALYIVSISAERTGVGMQLPPPVLVSAETPLCRPKQRINPSIVTVGIDLLGGYFAMRMIES